MWKQIGMWALDKSIGGFQAQGLNIGGYQIFEGNQPDVEAGKAAAYDVWQDQLGLLGDRRGLAKSTAESDFSSNIAANMMSATSTLGNIFSKQDASISKSGMANVGQINTGIQDATQDVTAKFKTDMNKIFDTRSQAMASADLAYRSGEMSAEEAYQQTLSQFDDVPTTFLEGMFG